jgi:hypothetical protein
MQYPYRHHGRSIMPPFPVHTKHLYVSQVDADEDVLHRARRVRSTSKSTSTSPQQSRNRKNTKLFSVGKRNDRSLGYHTPTAHPDDLPAKQSWFAPIQCPLLTPPWQSIIDSDDRRSDTRTHHHPANGAHGASPLSASGRTG